MLANLENGQPNPHIHAYGHYSLANDIQVEEAEDPAEPGNDLHITTREQQHEAWLQRKHQLAIKRARLKNTDIDFDDEEAEILGDDLVTEQRAAAA